MQLHQIDYFVAVAETRSFTRGAQRVHVVQSAVSAGIRQLERELGAELFERKPRSIRLTPAGDALLPRAREILGSLRAARDAVHSARGEVTGTVVLGTLAHLGPLDLPSVLHSVQARYPDVVVKLRQTVAGTSSSLAALRAGTLDLALVSAFGNVAAGIELSALHTEPVVFSCSSEHRLAGRAHVGVQDLVDESFVDFPEGWGVRAAVDAVFAAAGAERYVHTEVVDFEMALELVRRNLGLRTVEVALIVGSVDRYKELGPDFRPL